MDMDLSLLQTRVIGCLIEKEKTTPDQYPLTLNSLTSACNQKSNRDPVMELSDTDVQEVLDELNRKHLIREESSFGSRVPKYKHRFCNTEFSELKLSEQELAIVCTLFLRGPQTPGELRSRTNRLCSFSDVRETEAVLQKMSEREEYPLVVRMPREPGKRESRYAHLFSGEVEAADPSDYVPTASSPRVSSETIEALEARIAELEHTVAALQLKLAE
ncbi:YceH family protein [Amphritea pacifica]|uniref:DUF480 domain-containing protein n=1 Tax=Amphritea pacifica TaxID=2811233 RepID=A0ABS2W7Y6_9GAMM|nr:DUF480 domain-containing protein [Amphritea pacifica]MBN0987841.1 DUF480 domain-containing protein [Amphritea pacifica]